VGGDVELCERRRNRGMGTLMIRRSTLPPGKNFSRRQLAGSLAIASLIGISLWYLRRQQRPPVLPRDRLGYLLLLNTAVSSRNTAQLSGIARQLKEQQAARDLEEHEWQYFERIFQFAESGEWERASQACERLAESQRYRGSGSDPNHDGCAFQVARSPHPRALRFVRVGDPSLTFRVEMKSEKT
jgi:hypothetical protein